MNTELIGNRLPDMKKDELVKIISTTLAYIAVGVSLFMWAQVSGLEKGYFFGVFKDSPIISGFGYDTNYQQYLNRWYFYIVVGLCIYIIGKLLKHSIFSNLICLLSLSFAFYQFVDMFVIRWYWIDHIPLDTDNLWLNNSVYFHWFLFSGVVILISTTFISINKYKADSATLKIV